jgi:hypothetical protein
VVWVVRSGGGGLGDLGVALLAVVGRRLHHAVADVLVEQAQPDPLQGLGDRGDLGEHVDAVLVVLDHPLQPANLSFDPPQPVEMLFLGHRIASHRVGGYTTSR